MRLIDADALMRGLEELKEAYEDSHDDDALYAAEDFMCLINEAQTIPNKTNELKKIANKLLKMYTEAQEDVIWDHSGHIEKETEELHSYVKECKATIEKLCTET